MKSHDLQVSPEIGYDEDNLKVFLEEKKLLGSDQYFRIQRRSIDARGNKVRINVSVEIDDSPFSTQFVEYKSPELDVSDEPAILIVGAGPAGLFAGIKALELGLKPIIIERGKDVRARRRDLAAINKEHIVNPDSNYCFGEGGAGTYSDGKLYTRSKKRGSVRRIFEILVKHGAPENILIESHPHIGTNKLPKIVTALRETILAYGGEVHFEKKVVDILIEKGAVRGLKLQDDTILPGRAVVLATGHSARDIFQLLHRKNIHTSAKPFALGVRIEHPQELIDNIQYHGIKNGYLPPSAYALACQTSMNKRQRGMFSFCMCPGGFIVPAATAPGELVVNGMSPSRRDGKYANSGMVVAVELEDIPGFPDRDPLAGVKFQSAIEKKAWERGGRSQVAPAQRLMDFMEHKESQSLLSTSYQPGLQSTDLNLVLPKSIASRMRQGFKFFRNRMKGYLTNEAQLIGVESRTSSPVRIPRNTDTLEHPQIRGLFPCGEGAGYAGGIVSAAIDGEKCALAAAKYVKR